MPFISHSLITFSLRQEAPNPSHKAFRLVPVKSIQVSIHFSSTSFCMLIAVAVLMFQVKYEIEFLLNVFTEFRRIQCQKITF